MKKTTTPTRSTYEIITDKILEMLAAGVAPWRKPWHNAGPAKSIDGREYRGINRFILDCAPYENPTFMTYNRAKALGGCVKHGEHGFPVIFWKFDDEEQADGTRRRSCLCRHYHVFNVAQIDGLPEDKIPAVETILHEPIAEAEEIARNMPNAPTIEAGPLASYSPKLDRVRIPSLTRYEQAEEYYCTLFHELGHSTGHASRLDRKLETPAPFGSPDYSREELVAEMTAAFLCGQCGIEQATLPNSAAYLAGWMKTIKADPRAVVIAAAQAQKAADYIRGTTEPDEAPKPEAPAAVETVTV